MQGRSLDSKNIPEHLGGSRRCRSNCSYDIPAGYHAPKTHSPLQDKQSQSQATLPLGVSNETVASTKKRKKRLTYQSHTTETTANDRGGDYFHNRHIVFHSTLEVVELYLDFTGHHEPETGDLLTKRGKLRR